MQRESEKSHTKTKSYFQIFVKLGECREGREGDEREVGVEGGKKEMVEKKKKKKRKKVGTLVNGMQKAEQKVNIVRSVV